MKIGLFTDPHYSDKQEPSVNRYHALSYEKISKAMEYFKENGVDLVIGTHPHYIQPVEMLTDDAGNQMLVYYSLGNFINSTSDTGRGTADRMIGGMAEITVAKKETGEVYIKEYDKKYGNTLVDITITEGRNRQVRRMFESLGFEVKKLRRVRFGCVSTDGLVKGEFRPLKPHEVKKLYSL